MPKFRKVPLGKDGWPIHMPIPLPQHWCPYYFAQDGGKGCLAGWGRYVFSGGKDPNDVEDVVEGTPRYTFMVRVFSLLKLPFIPSAFDSAWSTGAINGKKATAAWTKAAAEFGYTEDV